MTKVNIPGIHAYNVNFSSDEFTSNALSPSAYVGFANQWKRNLSKMGFLKSENFYDSEVLPIIHHQDVSDGKILGEFNAKKSAAFEIADKAQGAINFSLLIDFKDRIKVKGNTEQAILDCMPNRFAGGSISGIDFTGSFVEPSCNIVTNSSGSILKGMKKGWVLSPPRKDTNVPIFCDDIEDYYRILDILAPNSPVEKQGWLIPLGIGFKLLGQFDDAKPKKGARSATTPHMFAKPMVSLAEYISTNNQSLLSLTSNEFSELFWKWNEADVGGVSYKFFNFYYQNNFVKGLSNG